MEKILKEWNSIEIRQDKNGEYRVMNGNYTELKTYDKTAAQRKYRKLEKELYTLQAWEIINHNGGMRELDIIRNGAKFSKRRDTWTDEHKCVTISSAAGICEVDIVAGIICG